MLLLYSNMWGLVFKADAFNSLCWSTYVIKNVYFVFSSDFSIYLSFSSLYFTYFYNRVIVQTCLQPV